MVERLVHSEANARRIAIVESCFGSAGVPLGKPGRVLVGEGVLTKLCRKKAKPRQFFLFNDLLVYGSIIINKKKYNRQHLVPLEDVRISSLEDDGPWKNGWQVISPKKSFAVFAATKTEKDEWMAHIRKCIDDLLSKGDKTPAKEHAAVWVPDSEAQFCMHCLKAKFTTMNRRHHCRKCGAVVCGACSNRRYVLPNQSDKPVRVCIGCFNALSAPKNDTQPTPPSTTPPSSFASQPNEDDEFDDEFEDEFEENQQSHIKLGGLKASEVRQSMIYGSSDEEEDEDHKAYDEQELPQFYQQ